MEGFWMRIITNNTPKNTPIVPSSSPLYSLSSLPSFLDLTVLSTVSIYSPHSWSLWLTLAGTDTKRWKAARLCGQIRLKLRKENKEWSEGLRGHGSSPLRSKRIVTPARWLTGVSRWRFHTGIKEEKKWYTKAKTKIKEKWGAKYKW